MEYNRNRNWWILLLVFLNIFIKPSYFFVWICVYPLFLFLSYHFKKEFWIAIVPAIIGVFLLVIEYSMIYFISPQVDGVKSGIIISPFSIYLSFYNHFRELPFTVIFSLLFPVLYVFLNWETAIKDKSVVFAALSTFVAIVIYLVFAETGPRANHGNFYWQVIPCSWLLFYVALINTLKMQHGYKRSVLIVVYFLHFIVGVVYIIRYMVFDNYI